MQTTSSETPANKKRESMNKDTRALKILAKSVYRELKTGGYSRSDIVHFTNALLEMVTSDIKGEPEQ